MRTEAKPVNMKTGKIETKRVKGKVKRAFYYEGELRNVGAFIEGFRHDFEQWPSKVQIVEETRSAPAVPPAAPEKKSDNATGKDSKAKEEKKS